VTRNYSEKSINNLLDFVEKQANAEEGRGTVEQFYSKTLESFKANNERLWLKTNLKLARLWVDRGLYEQVAKNLRELHRFCQNEDGTDDASKGTYSLEIYALEIQTFSALKNHKRLKVRTPGASRRSLNAKNRLRISRHSTNRPSRFDPPFLTQGSWGLFESAVERCT
jgi:hypothetical protein